MSRAIRLTVSPFIGAIEESSNSSGSFRESLDRFAHRRDVILVYHVGNDNRQLGASGAILLDAFEASRERACDRDCIDEFVAHSSSRAFVAALCKAVGHAARLDLEAVARKHLVVKWQSEVKREAAPSRLARTFTIVVKKKRDAHRDAQRLRIAPV